MRNPSLDSEMKKQFLFNISSLIQTNCSFRLLRWRPSGSEISLFVWYSHITFVPQAKVLNHFNNFNIAILTLLFSFWKRRKTKKVVTTCCVRGFLYLYRHYMHRTYFTTLRKEYHVLYLHLNNPK